MTENSTPDSTPKESSDSINNQSGQKAKLNSELEETPVNPNGKQSTSETSDHITKEHEAPKISKSENQKQSRKVSNSRKILKSRSDSENSKKSAAKKTQEEPKENDSSVLNDNPFSLKRNLERNKDKHKPKELELKHLSRQIMALTESIGTETDVVNISNNNDRKIKLEEKRDSIMKELDQLELVIHELEQKIKKSDSITRVQSDSNNVTRKLEEYHFKSLFEENDPLINTVLYVATFFPELNPPDFEQVVSFLLKDQTTTITVKSQIATEQGEVRLIEKPEKKPIVEVWKETPHDIFLHNCYLSSIKQEDSSDSSQIIDFAHPQLRKEVINFFKEERTVYLSNQFNQARFLLFNSSVSEKVAINAMYLSVDMAISSPYAYGKDWLFEIIVYFTKKDNQNIESESTKQLDRSLAEIAAEDRNFIFGRISSLISAMLDYSQLQGVVKQFLEDLISVKRYDAVLGIMKRLHSAPQFDKLYWVKQLLDEGDEGARSEAYKFLCSHLKENDSCIYDLLKTIKTWLPESDCHPDKYSNSNKYALQLLVDYSIETIGELNLKDYGLWRSKYPLFAPMYGNEIDSKIEILITWLFHSDSEGEAAIKYINFDEDISSIEVISFLIAQWFMILRGLEKKQPEQEVSEVINKLIQKTILCTNRSQQKELISFWDLFIDYLQDEAEAYEKSEDNKARKQTLQQRNIVKELKSNFKATQKLILAK